MSVEEIVRFELKALSKTVKEYTTDNYIASYAEQLATINYPEEKDNLILLIDRLLEWYELEMKEIQKSDYVRSKESHKKSYKLLKELKDLLQAD